MLRNLGKVALVVLPVLLMGCAGSNVPATLSSQEAGSTPTVQYSALKPEAKTPSPAVVATFASTPVSAPPSGQPRVVVVQDSFDFGQIAYDEVVSATFEVRNTGAASLTIASPLVAKAAEGC